MEQIESTKPSTGRKIVKGAAAAVLAGCLVASLGMNIYQADQAHAQNQKVNKFIDNQLERQAKEEEQENAYQEDGFKVGEQYEIRSTTHISDAYKSGDNSQLSEEDKKTLDMASEVIKEIIKDNMTDYEKELAVYDWLRENIGHGSGGTVTIPGSNDRAFTPFNVLSSRQAVCVGYATTFRLFMNMLGMDCHIVHNDYHSWDLVQIDDGWYHVDVYSDASGCPYQNFNMTDLVCKTSHEWDESALPDAVDTKYSYAVQNSKEIKDIFAIPKKMKKIMDKKESASVFFRFKKPFKQDELGIADFLVNQINAAMMSTPGYDNCNFSGSWYQDDKDEYLLGLFFMNYENMESVDTFDSDSKEGRKLLKAISKAFGVDLGGSSEGSGEAGDAVIEDVLVNNTQNADGADIITADGRTVTVKAADTID